MTKFYLVPVERKEEFERILIEYFDSGVKKCDCEKFSVGAVANGQDVIGHFEGADVDQRYNSPALMRRSCTVQRKPNHSETSGSLIHDLTVAILYSRI
jgi:hypothetical protein